MNRYSLLFIGIIISICSSCNKWLDVQPSDRVTEENAFSSPQSFKQALNGIYIELNKDAIYGKALTSEFIDILAHYYSIHPESVNNYELTQHKYTSTVNLSRIQNIWGTSYNLISNTNKIIENLHKNTTVLAENEYALIYGETLALRALLHFDLFRLFGPIYSINSTAATIPYYTKFSLDVATTLPAKDYLEQVIADLQLALEYLKNDPIITNGPYSKSLVKFNDNRVFRLNYFAVKGLLARVYLYANLKEEALVTAKEVIAVQEQWFPFIDNTKYSSDRIYSTEILFGLQNIRRRDLFTSLFDNKTLNEVNALSPREDVVNYRLFANQRHDYRYIGNLSNTMLLGNTNYKTFEKYEAKTDSVENQIIPMLRMSEMYYIAAECEPLVADGVLHLNKVRNNRGIASSSSDSFNFANLLRLEYTREFWGEGQLFFFYKRKNLTSIQSAFGQYNQSMNASKYVLPIPEGETKYN
ncbi:RagB/SusD family nutrient uptake outer membrane protein [Sphingobacterium composti Ten et al. 2007 non Yoo et al. 2007]|uniref:RagB/SusD family nutrient uptake outer membrane protein n=1 Tax=Sphingobacterium composti TaxID=363260 RepID=UPI00135AEEB2|nr:RagB/SusD family nutrient uptake outer membrane protein [Sphingobacterium composti Ten et al. 2007 non Yoo et al. 2007]